MKATIITIGEEILIGQIVDTNSAWIAEELNLLGIKVQQILSISDNKKQIIDTVESTISQSDLVIITGGLGPTNDDITKHTLAEYFNSKLVLNEEVLADVAKIIGDRGAKMLDLNRNQAMVPECCTVLRNPKGTAPGMWFEKNDCVIISLPGVPFEMKAILTEKAFPLFKTKFKTPNILHRIVHTTGYPESELADILKDWEANLPKGVGLAYLPSPGDVKLRLDLTGDDQQTIKAVLDNEIDKLKQLIPEAIFGYDKDTIEAVVSELLRAKQLTLSTAESCTSGRIASMLTSLAGSSEIFKGSVVAYSNEVKQNVLGVDEQILNEKGAVSQEVVKQMASGVRKLMKTHFGIATSGVAGPGGGTLEKPVGTVWIAVASESQVLAIKHQFGNSRMLNIQKSSALALNILRKLLTSEENK